MSQLQQDEVLEEEGRLEEEVDNTKPVSLARICTLCHQPKFHVRCTCKYRCMCVPLTICYTCIYMYAHTVHIYENVTVAWVLPEWGSTLG